MAIIAPRWPSPWQRSRAEEPHRDRGCRECRHLVPGLRREPRAGVGIGVDASDDSRGRSHRHHRRAQRLRQGHHQPRRRRAASAGTCSTAAPSTGWWPLGGLQRRPRSGRRRRPRAAGASHGRGSSASAAAAASSSRLDGHDVTAQVRSEKPAGRAPPGWRPGPPSARPSWPASTPLPRPPAGGRRAGHGHRRLPGAPTSRFSSPPAPKSGPRVAISS